MTIKKYDYNFNSAQFNHLDKDVNIETRNNYFLCRSVNMFTYDNSDTLNTFELEKKLQTNGYCVVIKHNHELLALSGVFTGKQNAYGIYDKIHVINTFININEIYTIDVDCILVKNDSLQMGLLTLINRLNTLLVENEITTLLTLYSKRMINLITANDDNTYRSAVKFLKKIIDGEIGIVAGSKLFDSLTTKQLENSNDIHDLLDVNNHYTALLYNEIGLKYNSVFKRERLITEEINHNSSAIKTYIIDMLNNRKNAIDKINIMFNTNIVVNINDMWFDDEAIGATEENDPTGATGTAGDNGTDFTNEADGADGAGGANGANEDSTIHGNNTHNTINEDKDFKIIIDEDINKNVS
jgi:hypothetical protein